MQGHPQSNLYSGIRFRVVLLFTILVIGFIVGSAVVYGIIEEWSWSEALYFSVISITTVGYGDIVPMSTGGKVANLLFTMVSFCGLFIIARVVIGYIVENQIDAVIKRIKSKKKQRLPKWRDLTKEATDLQKLADDAQDEIEEEIDEAITTGRDLRIYFHMLIYFVWLLMWTMFYALHEDEGLSWFDSFYLGVITSTTIGMYTNGIEHVPSVDSSYSIYSRYFSSSDCHIGYGQYYPRTQAGKWFCIWLTLIGVISLSVLATTASRGLLSWIKKLKCAKKKGDPNAMTPEQAQLQTLEVWYIWSATIAEGSVVCFLFRRC